MRKVFSNSKVLLIYLSVCECGIKNLWSYIILIWTYNLWYLWYLWTYELISIPGRVSCIHPKRLKKYRECAHFFPPGVHFRTQDVPPRLAQFPPGLINFRHTLRPVRGFWEWVPLAKKKKENFLRTFGPKKNFGLRSPSCIWSSLCRCS